MEGSTIGPRSIWLSPTLFLVTFVAATYPTLAGIVDRWFKLDESYSHGFLVLAVCLVLSFQKVREIRPKPGFYAIWLVPLLVSVALYAIGDLLLIEAIQQVALLPILFSGLLVQWGWRQTIPFLVPVGLIVFAIPFWDYLSWSLQLITVAVNQFLLSHLGIDFVVEGVFVYFPGVGAFEIANGCSGLRYLLVGLTLTFLYGELNFQWLRSRIQLILVGVVLSLVANWIRVFVIIYQGYTTQMTSSLVYEHDFFGWWVFAATLVPVFLFARWREHVEARAGSELAERPTIESANRPRVIWGAVGAVLPVALLAGLFLPGILSGTPSSSSEPVALNIRLFESSRWLPLFDRELAGWHPVIEKPDRLMEETYMEREALQNNDAKPPEYFVGVYSYDFQRPGAEVVQYGNRIYDGEKFVPKETFSIGQTGEEPLAGLTIQAHNDRLPIHLAYGYYVEGRWETHGLQAKFAQLPGIFNSRTDASLVIVGVRCDECDGEQALKAIAPDVKAKAEAFLDDLYLTK